jgi:hypothetical protein
LPESNLRLGERRDGFRSGQGVVQPTTCSVLRSSARVVS